MKIGKSGERIQWFWEDSKEVHEFLGYPDEFIPTDEGLVIVTRNGYETVKSGDYIKIGKRGEFIVEKE